MRDMDKTACRILAEKLFDTSLFKGKTIEKIALLIPEFQMLSEKKELNGSLIRNFGRFSAVVYDIEKSRKHYESELEKAKSMNIKMGSIEYRFIECREVRRKNFGCILLGYVD